MAASTEDPATVLEQFTHDVANLPAEITHLMEEIQAKDQIIQECKQSINQKDRALQKWVKDNGGHVKHPKEEQWMKQGLANYDRALALQEQKEALSERAAFLLDRHVKRLDLKIQELQNDGTMLIDPQLPSIFHDTPANLVGPPSSTGTGTNTPLHPLVHPSGSSTSVANAAMVQMQKISNTIASRSGSLPLASSSTAGPGTAPVAAMQPHPLLDRSRRETSVSSAPGVGPNRRRPTNTLGSLPPLPSNLRQQSLGPGTPKAGTPGAGSRAGSAGPRSAAANKKAAAAGGSGQPATTRKVAPHQAAMVKKQKSGKRGTKSALKRLANGQKGMSPSTNDSGASGSEMDEDDGAGSATGKPTGRSTGNDGANDEEEEVEGEGYGDEDEGEDNKLYCTCRSISHGNMIACDNDNCPYEWFHWECVGMTQEPKGRWLCPHCKKLPAKEIKVAR